MNAMDVSLICKALGDSNRLQIVGLLTKGEMCACKLLEHFQITQPTLSHHMKILKDAGVINVRREGTRNYYYLDPDMKSFKVLISVLQRSVDYSSELPYRGEE